VIEPPRDSWLSPKIEFRASVIHGTGTYAKAPIRRDEVVEIWGEYSNGDRTVEYTSDTAKADAAERQGKAVMRWDTDLYSIEDKGADEGYFINHSCDSNLWFWDAFTVEARRDIEPGEELTLDYALFEWEDEYVAITDCRCGSAMCRGTITGSDWRNETVQEMYAGHFSPLLNKRIAQNR
jgi:uncharacterized protein